MCASNVQCNTFLYCFVLLMRIHSELRELLPSLLFVAGSWYFNHVVLLLHDVTRECLSERMKQWIIFTHLRYLCSQERILGIVYACDFYHALSMCLVLVSSIRPSDRWLDAISSNGLRCSSSIYSGALEYLVLLLWSPYAVGADVEILCIGKVCSESANLSIPLST